jgi:hypothetical protein
MPVRMLEHTRQEWVTETDAQTQVLSRTYNTPLETGKSLDAQQGKFAFPLQFLGTCGLVSCVNILRLAGREETTEEEIVSFALQFNLCSASLDPDSNGGTNFIQRQSILKCFGLDSELLYPSIAEIAQCVSEGRGVIISVDAGILWQDPRFLNGLHAIVVTSVKIDPEGKILGFYICDSGSSKDDSARYCDAELLAAALSGMPMNVTSAIIR